MGSDREVNNLVLYDGVCTFCNSSVNFILDQEESKKLNFTPLQSELGKSILQRYNLPSGYVDSILFLQDNKLYSHSQAVFEISKFLKWPWSWVSIFSVFPKYISDLIYRFVAKHRYKILGKKEVCIVPEASDKSRFFE